MASACSVTILPMVQNQVFVASLALSFAFIACGDDADSTQTQSLNAGGQAAAGGDTAAAGAGFGGAQFANGTDPADMSVVGGAGGEAGNAGPAGGATSEGVSPNEPGGNPSGGSASGGAPSSGGNASGGTTSAGGSDAMGGDDGTGGSDATGGNVGTEPTAPMTEYVERNGVVIIEAENTQSELDQWELKTDIDGFTGPGYLEFTGNQPTNGPATSPLTYTFSVTQAGLYFLHMHIAKEHVVIDGETRTDVANDAYVRLDGDYGPGPNPGDAHGDDSPLENLMSNTKFFGGNNNSFAWASGNRLDLGGHVNKRVAVYDLKAGVEYTFTMSGRSQLFKVNRFVFQHEDISNDTARDLDTPETK